MGSPNLPFDHAIAGAIGAAAATAIPVGGILASSVLLTVIAFGPGGASPAGLDPAAFTVANGSIQSATVDTSGKFLQLIYTRG